MTAESIRARAESRKNNRHRTTQKPTIDTDKVAKLVRMLASDRDGEVLAAVAALKRTLAAGGADLNDMAAAIATGLTPRPPAKSKQQQPIRWAPPAPDGASWEALAWYAHYHRRYLTTVDADYVAGVLVGQHFDCGRADASMMHRLRNIVAKIQAARSADWSRNNHSSARGRSAKDRAAN
jgi:hypothetical protein